jgi:hypothetical protein
MWREPYLETCCRSALHRVILAGTSGRPASIGDAPCLDRLASIGLVIKHGDDRYHQTREGTARHTLEVLNGGPGED